MISLASLRHPNGAKKRGSLTQREREAVSVAHRQPHRAASSAPEHEWRCELIGRLILDLAWGYDDSGNLLDVGPMELWDASQRFRREYHAWQRAKASRRPWANGARGLVSLKPEDEEAAAAQAAIARYGDTMLVFGKIAARCYEAALALILADQPEDYAPQERDAWSAHDALVALALHYRGRA